MLKGIELHICRRSRLLYIFSVVLNFTKKWRTEERLHGRKTCHSASS